MKEQSGGEKYTNLILPCQISRR